MSIAYSRQHSRARKLGTFLAYILFAELSALQGACSQDAISPQPAASATEQDATPTVNPPLPQDAGPGSPQQHHDSAQPDNLLVDSSPRRPLGPPADDAAAADPLIPTKVDGPSAADAGRIDWASDDAGADGAPATNSPPAAGQVVWTNGTAEIAVGGVMLSGLGSKVALDVSVSALMISQEELISFVQSHRELFTDSQYQTLTTHSYYTKRGYGADLLLGMVGLVLGGDVDYYHNHPQAAMDTHDASQRNFVDALSQLRTRSYTMKGRAAAIANTPIPSSPRFYAEVTRLGFANGTTLRAVNTQLSVTDQQGGSGLSADPTAPPLALVSNDASAQALEITEGYGAVAQGSGSLEAGGRGVVDVSKPLQCVSHEQLTAFLRDHEGLFAADEYATLTQADFFGDTSRTPDLLLAMLGARFGGSVDYFQGATSLEVGIYDAGDQELAKALSTLENAEHTLTGAHPIVNVGAFAAMPQVFAFSVRVRLPDGHVVRVVGTRAMAAEEDGSRDDVRSQDGAPALQLTLTPG